MNDTDRLLSYGKRVLTDGCGSCGFSLVYCRCVTYTEGNDARCCPDCDH